MKKLLPFKIRPFNMANFSSGSGYFAFHYLFILLATYLVNAVANVPLTLVTALISKSKGKVKVSVLKKVLYFFYIPVAAVATIVLTIMYMDIGFIYTGDFISLIGYIYCAATPFLIIYFAFIKAMNVILKEEKTEREKTESETVNEDDGEEKVNAWALLGYSFWYVFLYSLAAAGIGIVFIILFDWL